MTNWRETDDASPKPAITTVPVVEERLRVEKREVETDRLLLHKTVQSHDELVETSVLLQDLTVERVPVGRLVQSAPPVREEGGVVIIPVLEERTVVETRLFLAEEIHIRRTERTRTDRQNVQLRRELVDIERPPNTRTKAPKGTDKMATETTSSTAGTSSTMGGTASGEQHIVVMYDTYQDARAARDKLLAEGLASSDMDLLDRNAQADDASFAYEHTSEGFWGAIKRLFMPDEDVHGYAEGLERGHAMLVVRPRHEQYDHIIDVLETTNPVDFEGREQEWRGSGWTGTHAGHAAASATPEMTATPAATSTATPTPATSASAAPAATGVERTTEARAASVGGATAGAASGRADEVIPVVEEQVRIGKRQVGRGSVRIRSYVVERPVSEQVRLREERIDVERRPTDRPLGTDQTDPFRERVIEVSATGEEAVVAKEAHVVEEIAVRKEATERTEEVHDTVRRTEVEVEDNRTGTTGTTGTAGAGTTAPGTSTSGTTTPRPGV